MSDGLYPIGYGTWLGTLAELKSFAKFGLMEPTYARRLEAWLTSRDGDVGIGGAFRTTQPPKPGFAPNGKSFHQLQTFNDGTAYFMAVDLVCRNGGNVHRAPTWAEVPRQGSGHADIQDYGVHCNVPGEPWHMQAIEIDGYDGWVNRGRPHPNPDFPIKGGNPPITGAITVEFTSRYLQEGMSGNDVIWLQNHLVHYAAQSIVVDGRFGGQTKEAVMNWQRFFGLTVDGEAGEKTQRSIIEIALQSGR